MTEEFYLYEVGGYNSGKIGFGHTIGIVSVDMMNCVTDPKAPMGRSPMGQAAYSWRTWKGLIHGNRNLLQHPRPELPGSSPRLNTACALHDGCF